MHTRLEFNEIAETNVDDQKKNKSKRPQKQNLQKDLKELVTTHKTTVSMPSETFPLMGNNESPAVSFRNRVMTTFKLTLKSLPVNYLLVFVPLGLLAGILDWGSSAIFWLNFFAIVPLASLLAFATEELAEFTGETIGGSSLCRLLPSKRARFVLSRR